MPITQWLAQRWLPSPRRTRTERRRFRPGLESLEERWVPSTLIVDHDLPVQAKADRTHVHGTLPWAVATAQSGDTILLTGRVLNTGVNLVQGELLVTQKNLTIQTDARAAPVTISANYQSG